MKDVEYLDFADEFHASITDGAKGNSYRTPLEGMIELTRLCTIKCTHCYIGDARWIRDENEMTFQQVIQLLDILAERGTLWLCFTGGEPLLRKDFKEIWLYAKSKGFLLTLFTNATLISPSLAEFLAENPPFNLEVSIYGATLETYERVSQVKGSFKRFMNGVENLRKHKIPWKMKTVVIQENAHELQAMKELAQTWRVSFYFDGSINPSIGEESVGGKAPCATRIDSGELGLIEIEKEKLEAEKFKKTNQDRALQQREFVFDCGAGKNSFYINSQGKLQMCILTGHRGHDLKAGNTISEEFDRGWLGFDEVRKVKRDPKAPCSSCDISHLCDSCGGFAYLENKNESSPVEYLCRKTHLKAHHLGIPHRCQPNHFVYDSERKGKVGKGS